MSSTGGTKEPAESSDAQSKSEQSQGEGHEFVHRRIQAYLEKYRAYREKGRDPKERKYRLEHRAFWVAAAYTAVSIFMWRAMIAANNLTQQSIRASERPDVSLGKQDGTIAELRPNDSGYTNIIFWFHNAGRESAHDFILNVCTFTMIMAGQCKQEMHLRPRKPPIIIKGFKLPNQWVGVDIPPDSDRKELRLAIKDE